MVTGKTWEWRSLAGLWSDWSSHSASTQRKNKQLAILLLTESLAICIFREEEKNITLNWRLHILPRGQCHKCSQSWGHLSSFLLAICHISRANFSCITWNPLWLCSLIRMQCPILSLTPTVKNVLLHSRTKPSLFCPNVIDGEDIHFSQRRPHFYPSPHSYMHGAIWFF